MPQSGLATQPRARRRPEIWTDDAWLVAKPSRRRGSYDKHLFDADLHEAFGLADGDHASGFADREYASGLADGDHASGFADRGHASGSSNAARVPSSPPPASRASVAQGSTPPARRTVTITGHPADRHRPGAAAPGSRTGSARQRVRAGERPHERPGFRPDRVAMWAVLLGLALVLIAATSSHAAMLAHTLTR